jgi:hypothetical protein
MTKKKAPVSSMAEEIAKMQAETVARASKLPEIAEAAKNIMAKTVLWATDNGLLTSSAAKTASPASKRIEKGIEFLMDNKGATGNSGMNSNQWSTIKELFEFLLDESLDVKALKSSKPKLALEMGTAVKMLAAKYDHGYPIGECLFVVDPSTLRGVTRLGVTPSTGAYLVAEKGVLGIATEPEIVEALVAMYINNNPVFNQVAASAK